jgi:hypothetical protein
VKPEPILRKPGAQDHIIKLHVPLTEALLLLACRMLGICPVVLVHAGVLPRVLFVLRSPLSVSFSLFLL